MSREVAEPEPGCAHRSDLKLHPWDPEVARLRRIARRRGVKLQTFCSNCRRWVAFTAWRMAP